MSKSRRRKEKREARKAMQEVTWRIRRDMEARETATTHTAEEMARLIGANAIVGGDPRGYCLKLDLPTGRYNTWGGAEEGWGVPT